MVLARGLWIAPSHSFSHFLCVLYFRVSVHCTSSDVCACMRVCVHVPLWMEELMEWTALLGGRTVSLQLGFHVMSHKSPSLSHELVEE